MTDIGIAARQAQDHNHKNQFSGQTLADVGFKKTEIRFKRQKLNDFNDADRHRHGNPN